MRSFQHMLSRLLYGTLQVTAFNCFVNGLMEWDMFPETLNISQLQVEHFMKPWSTIYLR
jgi:hypothetical protein